MQEKRRKLISTLMKYLIGLGILFFLIRYLLQHWEEWKVLVDFSILQLVQLYLLYFLVNVLWVPILRLLIHPFSKHTRFWDIFVLNHAGLFLNYAPMKAGTLLKANYLKAHYDLPYTSFASFFWVLTLLMAFVTSLIGAVSLLIISGLETLESHILMGIFSAAFLLSSLGLWIPLPAMTRKHLVLKALHDFVTSRNAIVRHKFIMTKVIFLLILTFLLTAFQLAIIFQGLKMSLEPGGYLMLGSISFLAWFVGITPGALGIRELALSCGALVLGIPFETGILIALIDRTVISSYAFIAGGVSTLLVWKQSSKVLGRCGVA